MSNREPSLRYCLEVARAVTIDKAMRTDSYRYSHYIRRAENSITWLKKVESRIQLHLMWRKCHYGQVHSDVEYSNSWRDIFPRKYSVVKTAVGKSLRDIMVR
jgi:hypothetical protein